MRASHFTTLFKDYSFPVSPGLFPLVNDWRINLPQAKHESVKKYFWNCYTTFMTRS
ncbi:hypothetical protein L228DRAFT_243311 [Xylona heveae TC161]|uniref:Uncharacterized protein n=1 Tax=Xylona heveae (strain CBS 132557 / TC161) TaxID=1328760 RepID=A0A165JYJ3_XYLHT|nr:hypothetical protein L228DRAFT_243311 [Xylona heveae TC161]KZF26788.1 hypothetical protein L228DRAFT_243311 [Xylona heveae TC161]